MTEWLGDHLWALWVAIAVVLAVAELVSLDLVLLMLAVGAGAGGLLAALGAPLAAQVPIALAVSVAMLGLVRPPIVHRLHGGPGITTGHAALVGRQGVVLEEVDSQGGRIKLAGEVWSARSFDPSAVMKPGDTVDVFEIDGATAVVYPADTGLV